MTEDGQARNENDNMSESAIDEASHSQCQGAVCEEQSCTASYVATEEDYEQQQASNSYERVQDYEQQQRSKFIWEDSRL